MTTYKWFKILDSILLRREGTDRRIMGTFFSWNCPWSIFDHCERIIYRHIYCFYTWNISRSVIEQTPLECRNFIGLRSKEE